MPTNEPELDPNATEGNEVAFDYVKSADFRMVWVDGAIGGRLPSGMVHFALYGERPAIPRREVYRADLNSGKLIGRVHDKTISRGSIVREMCCDAVMTVDAARQLAHWLLETTEAIEALEEPSADKEKD